MKTNSTAAASRATGSIHRSKPPRTAANRVEKAINGSDRSDRNHCRNGSAITEKQNRNPSTQSQCPKDANGATERPSEKVNLSSSHHQRTMLPVVNSRFLGLKRKVKGTKITPPTTKGNAILRTRSLRYCFELRLFKLKREPAPETKKNMPIPTGAIRPTPAGVDSRNEG